MTKTFECGCHKARQIVILPPPLCEDTHDCPKGLTSKPHACKRHVFACKDDVGHTAVNVHALTVVPTHEVLSASPSRNSVWPMDTLSM